MKNRSFLSGLGASVGMLMLIIDGKTALEGMQTGIWLCLVTVIPSLFPFFLLSILLTSSFMGTSLPLLRPLAWICGLPKGAESLLIPGFLGGYPVGAQAVAEGFRSGALARRDAERMLGFCNNAGPAFLFGMVSSLFPRLWMTWALWVIHVVSAVAVAVLFPAEGLSTVKLPEGKAISLTDAMSRSIRTMATVCGWVILFRVVIGFADRWVLWLFPAWLRVAVMGMLELSNGCWELAAVADVPGRFVLCSGMLSFGGLSVTMQTLSVTAELSRKYYVLGKLLQTVFSVFLSWAVMWENWYCIWLCLPVLVIFLRARQKSSSIPGAVGV